MSGFAVGSGVGLEDTCPMCKRGCYTRGCAITFLQRVCMAWAPCVLCRYQLAAEGPSITGVQGKFVDCRLRTLPSKARAFDVQLCACMLEGVCAVMAHIAYCSGLHARGKVNQRLSVSGTPE